jgi:DNA-binding MarR family transcriptional regulator
MSDRLTYGKKGVYKRFMKREQLDIAQCMEMGQSCIGFNLRKTVRAVTQAYDDAFRPLGLRGTQFSLLAAIRVLGPITVNRLAEPIVMDRTTLTRNLRPLEKQGLVRINPGKDKREREVTLTTEGTKMLAQAVPIWKDVQARLTANMGKDRVTALLTGLRAAVDAVK